MPPDRLRSIVPMFGGATSYVDTLDEILAFVSEYEPSRDELVSWHRGHFDHVSSRDSILRRVAYLEDVGLLVETDGYWNLGEEGETYWNDHSITTLGEILCRRNVGLRSLLYALTAGPMDIEAVNQQQLAAHPELGWDPSNTDMAKQRVNWLRSLGFVTVSDAGYRLTAEGNAFVSHAVDQWTADAHETTAESDWMADTYETTATARAVDPEFRRTVLHRYDTQCPVSRVDHSGLLDVAHVLPWSDYPDQRADLGNVLPLSKTHHAAFDRGLFTIDREYRLHVNPDFTTESRVLHDTLIEQAGTTLDAAAGQLDPDCLTEHNAQLEWTPASG